MKTTISGRVVRVVLAGVAAVGAVFAIAPIASADPGVECEPQEVPSSDQCDQQQQQGAGLPDLPRNHNANDASPEQPQQAPPQNPQQAPPTKSQQGIDLSDKNCWVVNGVPVMWSPAMSSGPGDVISWCPTTYGLTPH